MGPMLPEIHSLFALSNDNHNELISTVVAGSQFRFEHILSHGAASPPDFWYDQDKPEWVALVRGEAVLEFQTGVLELRAGDSLEIPSHVKHRVASTSPDAVWLALHYRTNGTEQKG